MAKRIDELTAASGNADPATTLFAGRDAALADPKTRKFTSRQVVEGVTDPTFVSLKIGSFKFTGIVKDQEAVGVTTLATGAEIKVDVTVAGAATGDFVIANPTAEVDDDVIFKSPAWVSAANTVSFKVRNETGGDLTDSWTFDILVLRVTS